MTNSETEKLTARIEELNHEIKKLKHNLSLVIGILKKNDDLLGCVMLKGLVKYNN